MKYFTLKNNLRTLALVAGLLLMQGCKKNDGPSAKEVAINRLTAKPWKVNAVFVNGVNKTSDFTGLTVTFTRTNYTTVNGNIIWPGSGTWSFTTDEAKAMKRDNDTDLTILELTDNALKLELNWTTTTFGGGREKSLAGQYRFEFLNN